MATSIRVWVVRRGARTYIRWRMGTTRKNEIEIVGGLPGLREWIREQFDEAPEVLVAMLLRRELALDNTLGNIEARVSNKLVSVDMSAADAGRTVTL